MPESPVSVNGRFAQVDRVDVVEHDLGVEALGVLEEALHQVGPMHAVDVGGPVVDVGGGHQLAALRDAGDQHRLEVGARGVDRGGVAGRAGAEDQDVGVFVGVAHDGVVEGLVAGVVRSRGRAAMRQSDMGMIPADAQAFNGDNSQIVGSSLENLSGRPMAGH